MLIVVTLPIVPLPAMLIAGLAVCVVGAVVCVRGLRKTKP